MCDKGQYMAVSTKPYWPLYFRPVASTPNRHALSQSNSVPVATGSPCSRREQIQVHFVVNLLAWNATLKGHILASGSSGPPNGLLMSTTWFGSIRSPVR